MVLPLIGGLIGAGGSIAAGLIGADAAADANEKNWQINLLNYYQRENERQDRIRSAQENKREQRQGFIDADGNSTKFVEGRGWVSTRAPKQQKISDLQDKEQLNVLTNDLPMKRRFMDRNEQRSILDDDMADSLRRSLKDTRELDDRELASMLYNIATNRVNEGFDNATGTAMREAARTGSSNTGRILADLNDQRAKALADAGMESFIRARGQGAQEFNAKRGALANLYNMFATRASVAPDVSYRPQNIDNDMPQFASQGSRQMLSAGNALAEAFGKEGGTLDYVSPNYGYANAIGGGASALASALRLNEMRQGGMSSGGVSSANYSNRLIE